MRGHIRKRGSWEYIVELGDQPRQRCTECTWKRWGIGEEACPQCGSVITTRDERRQQSKAGYRTKKLAQQALNKVLRELDTGEHVEPSQRTVDQYLVEWLEAMRGQYRPGTWDTAKIHIQRYIVPRIGGVPLQELTPTRVKGLYAELRESGRIRGDAPLADKMVHNIHRTLSRALNDAVADRLLARNSAAKAHKMPETPEQPTWSAEQLRQFFAHEARDRWLPLWRTYADSGARRSELAGLRWSDVDLDGGRLNLVTARVKGGEDGVMRGRLKGKRGRVIELGRGTVVALKAWRKRQAAEMLAWSGEWGNDENLVFTHADGTPLHPDSITKLFQRRVAAASKWSEERANTCSLCGRKRDDHALPPIGPHGLRHTWASLALQAGVPMKVVQERFGHSSIAITGDVYSHVAPGMQADAAERVAGIIDREESTEAEEGEAP